MDILIKNVAVVGADGITPERDILIRGGAVEKIGAGIGARAERVIEGAGLHAFPGFIDLHCHLRDPGFTHKEDIVSGTRAAAAGGFTTVCCMPNTGPPADSVKTVRYIVKKAGAEGFARVLPVACVTRGMKGKTLTDFAALKKAGAVAFSDDGLPVQADEVIVAAMRRAKELGALLLLHEEDLEKRGGGVANAGENAERAGLLGIPRALEDAMTARDLFYAKREGARVHICHVSTAGSVELVRRAKANGVAVTCETGPHYFSLTDAAVLDRNPNAKVNPPLREEGDRRAVTEGLKDGTIDAIATDHAPHSAEEKNAPFERAPFGLIGFETAFPLAVTRLHRKENVGLEAIAALLCANPARILGIDAGRIAEGSRADIAVCDVGAAYLYEKERVVSRSQNSPFLGTKLWGRVVTTIKEGEITHGH